MTHFVLFNGDVYSSADPFATAVSVSGDTVAWVGGDEAARALDCPASDLAGDFVCPGFAAFLDLRTSAFTAHQLRAWGVVAVHALGTAADLAAWDPAAPPLAAAYCLDGEGAHRAVLGVPEDLSAGPGCMVLDTPEAVESFLTRLDDRAFAQAAARNRWRVYVTAQLTPAHAEAFGRSPLPLTLDPAACPQPVGAALKAGAQLSFALSRSPWETLRHVLYAPGAGLTGRGAFNCLTRFAERAVGNVDGGVIAPGRPAHLARWTVERLVVQAADDRLAAWSTDPRSGTPGLPDLSPGTALPVLRQLWIAGLEVEVG